MKQQQTDACLMASKAASCDTVNSNSVSSSVLNAKQKIHKFIQITTLFYWQQKLKLCIQTKSIRSTNNKLVTTVALAENGGGLHLLLVTEKHSNNDNN